MNILIADDTPSIRFFLQKVISDTGHTVHAVCDGHEALSYMKNHEIDMIFMDIQMPDLNGIETAKIIREQQSEWLPIIFISATENDKEFAEALSAGGDGILTKPLKPILVHAQIRAMQRIVDIQRKLHMMNSQLQSLSKTDVLTGVANRSGFYDVSERELKRCRREQKALSILMIDVDFFKQYNDNYGHLEGDHCLVTIAQALKNNLKRPLDYICRFGGEEFVVLLPMTDLDGARLIAQQLRQAVLNLEIPHKASSVSPFVSISIGAASNQDHINTFTINDLLTKADAALYTAKERGRNQIVAISPNKYGQFPTSSVQI
ncbi:GGDEF domain-containing response regulator [Zooshikella harenae]|uniref:diguanylate cyclase n=1 Tax=Zooshikella harenae TaxID=2827238 RepID=A0ABS5ZEW9_9GAMM|nr:diguanylate cyclase [Zooshikella harenae]MBU2712611.1 diguanylate cyclase [Zooshikella harenae]